MGECNCKACHVCGIRAALAPGYIPSNDLNDKYCTLLHVNTAYFLAFFVDAWLLNHQSTNKTNWKNRNHFGRANCFKEFAWVGVVIVRKIYNALFPQFLVPQPLNCCIALVNTPETQWSQGSSYRFSPWFTPMRVIRFEFHIRRGLYSQMCSSNATVWQEPWQVPIIRILPQSLFLMLPLWLYMINKPGN